MLCAKVLWAAVVLTLLLTFLGAAWLAPFLWFAFGGRLIQDAEFRVLVMLNILIWWGWSQTLTWIDLQALRKNRRALPTRDYAVEIPAGTHPWASQLAENIAERFGHLRDGLEVCFSFVPGVEFQRSAIPSRAKWRMVVGISAVAFLSAEELDALLLSSALARFHPAARLHFFFSGMLRRAERANSALPPDSGFFSFTRQLIECLISVLRSFPVELENWAARIVDCEFGAGRTREAFSKAANAGLFQTKYIPFYHQTAVKRGLMPPFAEGMSRLYGKSQGGNSSPAFLQIPGLWVYERRLLEGCLGRDCVSQLSLISWDDLHQTFGLSSWRENAAELRTILDGFTVGDIPELVREWRSVLRRWLVRTQRAPAVTPDQQREIFLFMLGTALGGVLLEAGWQVGSQFGQEISLIKNERSFTPLRLVKELGSGTVSSAAYERACLEAEIAGLTLGAPKSDSVRN